MPGLHGPGPIGRCRNVNRDFIGALLQLNAEKGVPREQLVRTVEDAIQLSLIHI